MKLFKLIVSLVILVLIGLFVYQNMETWVSSTSYKYNLYFDFTKTQFNLELYLVILLSALGGFLVGILALSKPYFRTRRLLKSERQEKKQVEETLPLKESSVEAS